MGVKDLWNVLAPIFQKSSLYDLQDQVIAIDLSCWVCEGQCIGEKVATQPRMYLRNLFFRTQTLLMMNVTPIFILEGEAPAMKHDAMKQRSDARFKKYRTADPGHDGEAPKGRKPSRSRFNGILKTCQQMLQHMGVMCLQSDGEAEALCGQLSREKLVDGVISQDSDVFLYGASTVYRNLTIKSGGGTVDVYRMSDIEAKLNLTRQKLVAMSLLCGCDYDQTGVQGVGKEIAFKYLSADHRDILHRLRSLRDDQRIHRLEEEKNGCSKCCHPGKLSEHKKDGCAKCGMSKGCEENTSPSAYKNLSDEDRKIATIEMILRKKAVEDPTFPNEQTIKEFLKTQQTIASFKPQWFKPNICKFVNFCTKMMEWDVEYCFEKILPLFTRWLLLNGLDNDELMPNSIVKKRIVRGVPSYDLAWEIIDENLASYLTLLPDDSKLLSDGMFVSIEPQILISHSLNDIYSNFIEKTTKKKKTSRKKDVSEVKKISRNKKLLDNTPKCSSPLVEKNLNVSFGLLNISGVEEGRRNNFKERNFNVSEKFDENLVLGGKEPELSENLDVTFGLINISGVDKGTSINSRQCDKSFNVSENFTENLVFGKESELNESILSNPKDELNFTYGAYDYPVIAEISFHDEYPENIAEVSREINFVSETISQNTIDIDCSTEDVLNNFEHHDKVDASLISSENAREIFKGSENGTSLSFLKDVNFSVNYCPDSELTEENAKNLVPSENTSKILQDSKNGTSLSFLKELNFSDSFNYCPVSEIADKSDKNVVPSESSENFKPIDVNFNVSFECFNSFNEFNASLPSRGDNNGSSSALGLTNDVTNEIFNDAKAIPLENVISTPDDTIDLIRVTSTCHRQYGCSFESFNDFNDVTINPSSVLKPKLINEISKATIKGKPSKSHCTMESFNGFNDVTILPTENVFAKHLKTSDVTKETIRNHQKYFGCSSESFNGFNDVTIQPPEKVFAGTTKKLVPSFDSSNDVNASSKNDCAKSKVQPILESLPDDVQKKLGKSNFSERQDWMDVSREESEVINRCDSSVEDVSHININETIDLEEDGDATVEYDLSAIVDDIVSRRHFY